MECVKTSVPLDDMTQVILSRNPVNEWNMGISSFLTLLCKDTGEHPIESDHI